MNKSKFKQTEGAWTMKICEENEDRDCSCITQTVILSTDRQCSQLEPVLAMPAPE